VPANLLAAPLLTPLTLGAMGLAVVAVMLPAALPLLLPPVALLCSWLIELTRWFAALPMAQWQLGRPEPWLVLLLAAASLALAWPGVRARWRAWAAAAVVVVVAVHLLLLRGDQLLLLHQARGDSGLTLLVARHQGREALLSAGADRWSCAQSARLAQGLGVQRFDWALLLDPLAPEDPACWQRLAPVVLASADGSPPLQPGERLSSPGLAVAPLSVESQALDLQIGPARWLLLPDRQSLWAWQELAAPQAGQDAVALNEWTGVWLGFRPTAGQRRRLAEPHLQRWFSAVPGRRPLAHWLATGSSGSLQWDGRHSHRLAAAPDGPIAH